MANNSDTPISREMVGVFDDVEGLRAAIGDLESHGFDHADLSLLAGAGTVEKKLGHIYRRTEELEDDSEAPRAAFVQKESVGVGEGVLMGVLMYVGATVAAGAVVASGGTLAAAFGAAAITGGSGLLIGAALAKFVGHRHAQYFQDQLDRGGILLWVRIRDAEHERHARTILASYSAHDIHVHELPLP